GQCRDAVRGEEPAPDLARRELRDVVHDENDIPSLAVDARHRATATAAAGGWVDPLRVLVGLGGLGAHLPGRASRRHTSSGVALVTLRAGQSGVALGAGQAPRSAVALVTLGALGSGLPGRPGVAGLALLPAGTDRSLVPGQPARAAHVPGVLDG